MENVNQKGSGTIAFQVDNFLRPHTLNWYVVCVRRDSKESTIEACLILIGPTLLAECFVPKEKLMRKRKELWQIETLPLFDGYAFMLSFDGSALAKKLEAPTVFVQLIVERVLLFASLSTEEQAFFEEGLDKNHILRFSRGVIKPGVTTTIEEPPKGYEQQLQKIDRRKRLPLFVWRFESRNNNKSRARNC